MKQPFKDQHCRLAILDRQLQIKNRQKSFKDIKKIVEIVVLYQGRY